MKRITAIVTAAAIATAMTAPAPSYAIWDAFKKHQKAMWSKLGKKECWAKLGKAFGQGKEGCK